MLPGATFWFLPSAPLQFTEATVRSAQPQRGARVPPHKVWWISYLYLLSNERRCILCWLLSTESSGSASYVTVLSTNCFCWHYWLHRKHVRYSFALLLTLRAVRGCFRRAAKIRLHWNAFCFSSELKKLRPPARRAEKPDHRWRQSARLQSLADRAGPVVIMYNATTLYTVGVAYNDMSHRPIHRSYGPANIGKLPTQHRVFSVSYMIALHWMRRQGYAQCSAL